VYQASSGEANAARGYKLELPSATDALPVGAAVYEECQFSDPHSNLFCASNHPWNAYPENFEAIARPVPEL